MHEKLSDLDRQASENNSKAFDALWSMCDNEVESEEDVTEVLKVYKYRDDAGYMCLAMKYQENTGADNKIVPRIPVIERSGRWTGLRGFSTGAEDLLISQYLLDMYYTLALEIEERMGVGER